MVILPFLRGKLTVRVFVTYAYSKPHGVKRVYFSTCRCLLLRSLPLEDKSRWELSLIFFFFFLFQSLIIGYTNLLS